ncbi:MAG: hypothetical protein Q7V53_03060 [Caldisericota bacterium]|nr:hypothetical protein [Caldisericota bacterium]
MDHIHKLPTFDDFVVVRRGDLEDLCQKVRVLWNSAQHDSSPLHFKVDQGLMSDAGVAGARIQSKTLGSAVRQMYIRVQGLDHPAYLLIPPGLTDDVVLEIFSQVLAGVGHDGDVIMGAETWDLVCTRLGRHGIAVQNQPSRIGGRPNQLPSSTPLN